MISTIAGMASRAWPKNSRQTVLTWRGMRCNTHRAEVITPSHPSFWTPGSPPRNLSVTSLPSPILRNRAPSMARRSVRNVAAVSGGDRPSFQASSKIATAFHESCRGCDSSGSPRASCLAGRPCATRPDCRRPFPTTRLFLRRHSSQCFRRCRRRRPRSGRPRTPMIAFGRLADAPRDDAR